jgi:hypothetical protein
MRPAWGESCREPDRPLDAGLFLLLLLIILAVAVAVLAPLRESRRPTEDARSDRLAELELRKEAKYAEIRDAETDFQAGKLSRSDHREIDGVLRAEAIAILEEIDRVKGVSPEDERDAGANGR